MKEAPRIIYHGTNLPYYISQIIKHEKNYQHDGPEEVQMSDEFGLSLGHAIRTCVQHKNELPLVLVIYSEKLHCEPGYRSGDEDGLNPAWTIDYIREGAHKVFPIFGNFKSNQERLSNIDTDELTIKIEEIINREIEKANKRT